MQSSDSKPCLGCSGRHMNWGDWQMVVYACLVFLYFYVTMLFFFAAVHCAILVCGTYSLTAFRGKAWSNIYILSSSHSLMRNFVQSILRCYEFTSDPKHSCPLCWQISPPSNTLNQEKVAQKSMCPPSKLG